MPKPKQKDMNTIASNSRRRSNSRTNNLRIDEDRLRAERRMMAFDQASEGEESGTDNEVQNYDGEHAESGDDGLEEEEEEEGEEEEEEVSEDSQSDSDDRSDDDTDSDESRVDDEIERIEQSLANIPFEKLAEIQEKVGMKAFHKNFRKQATHDSEEDTDEEESRPKEKKKEKKVAKNTRKQAEIEKRKHKNAPMEISIKRPVSRFREVVPIEATKRRDPRFDQLSGKLNQDLFEKSYSFIADYKQSELSQLKEKLKKTKNPLEKERLLGELKRLESKEAALKREKHLKELKRARKKAEMKLISEGKKPYFLKKSDEKKLELVERFNELKKDPKAIEKAIEKRRKRNAAKEHRRMPFKRRRT
ncbi:uncharacterized protein VTP21DRAFT_8955 [Calcarisporiella thermophila]|uniref:uncharacterized protein n=1 Tax=Calcarisporiella thermophila TaxID=911321 RepID=UPI0037420298